jgi:rSAM/selenodomain-associated transferase 2
LKCTDISIVIPALNEADTIESCLNPLQELRLAGMEVILVDGGSTDATIARAGDLVDVVISSSKGRARQMNAGFERSGGRVVLFLHSDTELPDARRMLGFVGALSAGFHWGFFNVELSGDYWWCKAIARAMNWRSRLTGIASGDQAIFIERPVLHGLGGFPEQPLMEDVEMSKRLKRTVGRGLDPALKVRTSSRRWRQNGVVKTVLLMWWIRLLYVVGISPRRLHRLYYRE